MVARLRYLPDKTADSERRRLSRMSLRKEKAPKSEEVFAGGGGVADRLRGGAHLDGHHDAARQAQEMMGRR